MGNQQAWARVVVKLKAGTWRRTVPGYQQKCMHVNAHAVPAATIFVCAHPRREGGRAGGVGAVVGQQHAEVEGAQEEPLAVCGREHARDQGGEQPLEPGLRHGSGILPASSEEDWQILIADASGSRKHPVGVPEDW